MKPRRGGAPVCLLITGASLWLACSSSTSGTGDEAAAPPDPPWWGAACTPDPSAEPTLSTEGYQRCSEVWAAEKNAGKPCLTSDECDQNGGVCVTRNGGTFEDKRCYPACNPSACPSEKFRCATCDGQIPHCEKDFDHCYPPSAPQVNGRGESCTATSAACTDTADCCSNRFGDKGTCYQLYTFDKPNTLSKPSCKTNCKTNEDCDDIYSASAGYCCLAVQPPQPTQVATGLTYAPLGTPNGSRTCVSRQFDTRCTRTPTSTSSSSSSSSSSSGSTCNYSKCVEACVGAGGSNCGEDCKCP